MGIKYGFEIIKLCKIFLKKRICHEIYDLQSNSSGGLHLLKKYHKSDYLRGFKANMTTSQTQLHAMLQPTWLEERNITYSFKYSESVAEHW